MSPTGSYLVVMRMTCETDVIRGTIYVGRRPHQKPPACHRRLHRPPASLGVSRSLIRRIDDLQTIQILLPSCHASHGPYSVSCTRAATHSLHLAAMMNSNLDSTMVLSFYYGRPM